MIKAIETEYNGYRFRSRLEARWAIFFDALRINYRYEPQGFDLDNIYYLPDFYLPDHDYWIEVKGRELDPGSEDWEKVTRLASALNKEVYVTVGDVWPPYDGERTINKWVSQPVPEPVYGLESPDEWIDRWERENPFPEVGNYYRPYRPYGGISSHHWWYECPACLGYSLVVFGHPHCERCNTLPEEIEEHLGIKLGLQFSNTPNLLEAYKRARSARFEHGEAP